MSLPTPDEIKKRCKAIRLTFKELCRRTGIAPSTLTRWRAGQTSMTVHNFGRLLATLTAAESVAAEDGALNHIPQSQNQENIKLFSESVIDTVDPALAKSVEGVVAARQKARSSDDDLWDQARAHQRRIESANEAFNKRPANSLLWPRK